IILRPGGHASSSTRTALWPDDGPVAAAGGAPAMLEGRALGRRILGGERLVDVDAEAGGLVGVEVAVLRLGTAGEDRAGPLGEDAALVDAEIVAGQLQRQAGRVADGRDVAGAVPGRLHAEELGEGRHLPRHAQPADLRDVDADEVDQAI